ncbi:MAG: PspC domain-containing protein, partial [Aeromicrobium sp.]
MPPVSATPASASRYRRAYRPADRRLVGGVATGLADHFGVGVLYVRLVLVVATWFNGTGIIVYLLLWRFLPLRQPELTPGLEAATRQGLRTNPNRTGTAEILQTLAIGTVGVGVLLFLQVTGRGISDSLVGPALVAVIGLTVIWRQFDDVAWRRWMRQTSGIGF